MSINRDQNNIIRADKHNSLGIELANRGWFDEATKEFNQAIANMPDYSDAYDNVASVYCDKKDYLKALEAYAKALALEPNNPYILHNIGCFLSNHAEELAKKCFTEASQLDDDLYESNFNLGLCFVSEDKHQEAIIEFEKALNKNNQDTEVRLHLALSLMSIKKFVQAIKELRTIIQSENNHDEAWYNLGICYNEKGFLEEAYKSFSHALKINPQRIDVMLSLASLLIRQKKTKEAKTLIKKSKELNLSEAIQFMEQDEYLFKLSK